jgi:hypothetical protein
MLEKFQQFEIENPQSIQGGEVTAAVYGDSGVE